MQEVIEVYLLLHEAGRSGQDVDELRSEIGEERLAQRVEAYRDGWVLAQRDLRRF